MHRHSHAEGELSRSLSILHSSNPSNEPTCDIATMNLTLHHFRKEARYLLPRWWLWVVALGIELLMDLEWLLPLQVQGVAWPAYACLATWGAGLLLAATSSPEEGTRAEQSFVATRPLPAASYWLARAGVFVVMIGLPLIMQEVIHLTLSQRPLDALLSGIGVRALRVLSVLGWAAAMSALWQGWRLVAALVLSAVIVSFGLGLFNEQTGISVSIVMFWHVGIAAVAIALLVLLVVVKKQREWSDRTVIAWQAVGCIAVAWLASCWPPSTWLDISADQPQAEALAKQAQMNIPVGSVSVSLGTYRGMESGRLMGALEAKPLPASCAFHLLPKASSARTADSALSTSTPQVPFYAFPEIFLCDPDSLDSKAKELLSCLPADTLLALTKPPSYLPSAHDVELPTINGLMPNLNTPVQISAEFDVHWLDWSLLCELPLQQGAEATTEDRHWSLKRVRFGEDAAGHPSPSALTIDCHAKSSAGLSSEIGASAAFLLYSPDRGIAWISNDIEWMPPMRALATSWMRHTRSVTWQGVLTHRDGTAAVMDRSQLKVIVIRPRHLGTTRWVWQPPPIKLADRVQKPDTWGYSTNEHLNRGTEQQAFDTRIASLTKPGANASQPEVLRYLWDVLSAARGLEFNEKSPPLHLRELLAEVAAQHLDDMLNMPDSMASPWANLLREVIHPLIQDSHKPVLLMQLSKQQWLASIIAARSWIAEAVQALDPLLQSTRPLNVHLRKLLLNSDEPAVRRRLLDNFRRHPHEGYEVIDHLAQVPEMRADLKLLADDLWQGFQPVLGIKQDNRLRLAIQMGNADALAMALRLVALGDNEAGRAHRLVFDLPRLLGLPAPPPNATPADLAPLYRRLKVGDFTYRTDKLQWEKKPGIAP